MDPPVNSSIDALNTATPTLADGPPQSIKHRCLEYCYTKHGRWIPQSIEYRCLEYCYTKLSGRWTPSQLSIGALNTTTPNLADGPPSIKHRCLEYCYTKLGSWTPCQSTIDVLNTTTPNLADGHPVNEALMSWIPLHQTWHMDTPVNQTYMPWKPLHQNWQNDPLNQP